MDRSSGLSGETKRSADVSYRDGCTVRSVRVVRNFVAEPALHIRKVPPAIGAGVFDQKGICGPAGPSSDTAGAMRLEVPRPGSVTGADLTVRPVGSRGGEGRIEGSSAKPAGNVSLSPAPEPANVAVPSQNILSRLRRTLNWERLNAELAPRPPKFRTLRHAPDSHHVAERTVNADHSSAFTVHRSASSIADPPHGHSGSCRRCPLRSSASPVRLPCRRFRTGWYSL